MGPHKRFLAWQECNKLVLAVYKTTASFPKHELYGLTSQARRAAFSAAVNIAEGSAKRGATEFRRFIDISIGSLAELAYILRLVRDLKLLSDDEWSRLDALRGRAGFMTWRLYQAVMKGSRRG